MRLSLSSWLLLFSGLMMPATRVTAMDNPVHPTLQTLPADKLAGMAPVLRGGDLALIESDDKGYQRQVTTMTLVAATPDKVREVVIHPERYGQFVRNMSESRVDQLPDGTLNHHWKLSYAIDSFEGVNHYVMHPDFVEMIDPTGPSIYRWEFLPSTVGGGTILVLYGYTDVRHSKGFVEKVLKRAGTLEHGLALITQMTLLLAMKDRAEKDPGQFEPYQSQVGKTMPSYRFLLDRGLVAVLHKQSGRLSGISLVDRSSAAPDSLIRTASDAGKWSTFVPSISKSNDLPGQAGVAAIEVQQSLPLMSWSTTWWVRAAQNAVDAYGASGDLRGARLRWDVRPAGDGKTELTLRTSQQAFDRENIIMRQLYKLEPLFEYGVNVGLDLVVMRAIKERAEQLTVQQAGR
jgi:hypothetical protein